MEGPNVRVGVVAMAKFDVRSGLMNRLPADLHKRLIYTAGPGAGPCAHAIARCRKLMDSKASCDFSTSSASARKAIAVAFAHASCSVMPYASAPGTSGISAIQRPSSSSSVSMLNCKSWLLTAHGGFRSAVTSNRMPYNRVRCM
jgi:hypothetical protein